MNYIRTTLRLQKSLKQEAEKSALEKGTTLQDVFNLALKEYLTKKAKQKAKKIVFHSHDLGVALDNLTRDDYYEIPRV